MMTLKVCSWNAHSLDLAKRLIYLIMLLMRRLMFVVFVRLGRTTIRLIMPVFMCLAYLLYVTDVDLRYFLV